MSKNILKKQTMKIYDPQNIVIKTALSEVSIFISITTILLKTVFYIIMLLNSLIVILSELLIEQLSKYLFDNDSFLSESKKMRSMVVIHFNKLCKSQTKYWNIDKEYILGNKQKYKTK